MPHQLTSSLDELWRGFVKANLIHHLAHTGDAGVLRRIGEAWTYPHIRPGTDTAANRLLSIPTSSLTPADLEPLARRAKSAWDWALLGLNYLRLWSVGGDWFARAEAAFDRALELEPSAWHLILRAEARRSRVDYAGALADFNAALKLEPKNALAWAFKARVLFQMRTEREDVRVIDRAAALAPKEGWILAWRGESLRRLGDPARAERDLRRGLELDPLYDQAYGWLARVLEAQGRHEEAIGLIRRGIELCPDFEKAYRPLVRALRGAGKVGEALEALDRAAALNHRNGWLSPWRVEGQAPSEDAARSLEALQAWLSSHPGDERARRWLGESLTQLGRHEEALAHLDGGHPWARAWKGEALYRLGRAQEAREAFDAALAADPSYGRAWAWRARLKLDAQDFEGALADLDQALGRKRVEYAWISAWRGEALLGLGRAREALAELDAAVALDAPRPEFRRLRARARYALHDVAGACDDLLRSCDGLGFPWSAVADAESLRRAGRREEALAVVDALAKARGKEAPFLYLLRYRLKAELGVKSAHRDVDAAFRLDPRAGWLFGVEPLPQGAPEAWAFVQDASFAQTAEGAPVWAYQGQARLSRGEPGGLSHLERAAELSPQGWILAWQGEARRKAGDEAGAREALEAALKADPKYANAWGWRGTLKLGADPRGAEQDLSRALKLQKSARFYLDRSRARRALGDLKGASSDMEEAVRLNPDLSWDRPSEQAFAACPVPAWKAELALRLGRPAAAKKLLARAKTALELVWRAECDLSAPSAAKDLARALRLEPKLAQVWAAKARRERSAAAALKAVRLAPYSASLRALAGELLLSEGKTAKAREQAEAALRLSHDHPGARDLLDRLTNRPGLFVNQRSLEFFTNYSCNAKCPFCFNPPDASPELDKGLPFAELSRRLYSGFQEGFGAVKFIGGEATLREDLPKIVGLAKKIGYRSIQLTTNGLRLANPAYARRLTALGVDAYRFSIHGHTPALHDALVAVPGALEKIEAAVSHLRPLGARLGINYVLSAENAAALKDTLLYFYEDLKIDDVIVYFLRYQGFAELPENRSRLELRFATAVPFLREAFAALRERGHVRMPALIHFAPCVAPELREHMLDWRRAPEDDDRVTLPDGSGGRIAEITNSGKSPVAACASCALKGECLGVETRYAARFGDGEFRPL